jgi:hypothetical protein
MSNDIYIVYMRAKWTTRHTLTFTDREIVMVCVRRATIAWAELWTAEAR